MRHEVLHQEAVRLEEGTRVALSGSPGPRERARGCLCRTKVSPSAVLGQGRQAREPGGTPTERHESRQASEAARRASRVATRPDVEALGEVQVSSLGQSSASRGERALQAAGDLVMRGRELQAALDVHDGVSAFLVQTQTQFVRARASKWREARVRHPASGLWAISIGLGNGTLRAPQRFGQDGALQRELRRRSRAPGRRSRRSARRADKGPASAPGTGIQDVLGRPHARSRSRRSSPARAAARRGGARGTNTTRPSCRARPRPR